MDVCGPCFLPILLTPVEAMTSIVSSIQVTPLLAGEAASGHVSVSQYHWAAFLDLQAASPLLEVALKGGELKTFNPTPVHPH